METIKALFEKYKELITYVFWGGMATVVNVASYSLCFDLLHLSNTASTLLAWAVSVIFAFVTNKIWVFHSRNTSWKEDVREFLSFTGFRLISELFDLGIMIWAVDMMKMNGLLWKILANVIVVILNYLFSKFIIFKKPAHSAADSSSAC